MTKRTCAKCGGPVKGLRDDLARLVCEECCMFEENCKCSGNVKLEKWVDIEIPKLDLDEQEEASLLDRAILAARQETKKR